MAKLRLYQHQFKERIVEYMKNSLCPKDLTEGQIGLENLKALAKTDDDLDAASIEYTLVSLYEEYPDLVAALGGTEYERNILELVEAEPGLWPKIEDPSFRAKAHAKHDPTQVRTVLEWYKSVDQYKENLYLLEEAESLHRKNGDHHIVIPDLKTLDTIDPIRSGDLDFRHVAVPFGAVAFSVPHPNGKRYTTLVYKDPDNWFFMAVGPDVYRLPSRYRSCPGMLHRAPESSASVDPRMKNLEGEDFRTKVLNRSFYYCMKALVYMQVYPESLKFGPGTDVLMAGNRKSRAKSSKCGKGKVGTMEILPEHKGDGKTYWVPPHFRTLHHPKFRRVDPATGELLEVGEEGQVRIVPVTGYMSKGRLHHIDKDATV